MSAASPLRQLLEGAPQAESISVDFKKGVWAFKPAAWYQAGAGTYLIVPVSIAKMALAADDAAAAADATTLTRSKFIRADYRAIGDQPAIQIQFEGGACDTYYRDLQPFEYRASGWNPAHWRTHHELLDQRGQVWRGPSKAFVTDDFGDLVEVAA